MLLQIGDGCHYFDEAGPADSPWPVFNSGRFEFLVLNLQPNIFPGATHELARLGYGIRFVRFNRRRLLIIHRGSHLEWVAMARAPRHTSVCK